VGGASTCQCEAHCQKCSAHEPLNSQGFCRACTTWLPWAASKGCSHALVELLSVNGRNLDGAVRKCALCGEVLS